MSVPTTWTVGSLSVGVFGVMSRELFFPSFSTLFIYVFIIHHFSWGRFSRGVFVVRDLYCI